MEGGPMSNPHYALNYLLQIRSFKSVSLVACALQNIFSQFISALLASYCILWNNFIFLANGGNVQWRDMTYVTELLQLPCSPYFRTFVVFPSLYTKRPKWFNCNSLASVYRVNRLIICFRRIRCVQMSSILYLRFVAVSNYLVFLVLLNVSSHSKVTCDDFVISSSCFFLILKLHSKLYQNSFAFSY